MCVPNLKLALKVKIYFYLPTIRIVWFIWVYILHDKLQWYNIVIKYIKLIKRYCHKDLQRNEIHMIRAHDKNNNTYTI